MQFYVGPKKLNPIEGLYCFMPAATLWMLLFIVPLELSRMKDEHAVAVVRQHAAVFLLSSVLGFIVNLLSFGVIRHTSALTFKVWFMSIWKSHLFHVPLSSFHAIFFT